MGAREVVTPSAGRSEGGDPAPPPEDEYRITDAYVVAAAKALRG